MQAVEVGSTAITAETIWVSTSAATARQRPMFTALPPRARVFVAKYTSAAYAAKAAPHG